MLRRRFAVPRPRRYREAVTREKSKLDTISSENDQLRKIISSGESPGRRWTDARGGAAVQSGFAAV